MRSFLALGVALLGARVLGMPVVEEVSLAPRQVLDPGGGDGSPMSMATLWTLSKNSREVIIANDLL
jgi:hypothetical protein